MKPGQAAEARRPRPRSARPTTAPACWARLDATVEAKGEDGEVTLAFDLAGPDLDDAIARARASCPCRPTSPPSGAEDERDRADYQTVYAREDGSVAAPTAGLHFTPELLARHRERGASRPTASPCTSGAGTFLPVKTDDVAEHRMHAEWGEVAAADRRAR